MNSRQDRLFLVCVLCIFFLLTASSGLFGRVFTSPDEVANATSALKFVQTGSFSFGALLPGDDIGILHPRSIQTVHGSYVPLSYLGYPLLLGSVGFVFGELGIRLLVPVLMTLALFAYYQIVQDFFPRRVAVMSLLLAASFPSLLFFTYKAFWHNAAFTALFILALYSLRAASRSKHLWKTAGFGVCLALAGMIRPNEAVWLLPFFGIVAINSRYRIGMLRLGLAAACALIVLLPMFIYNANTFGSPLSFGYTIAIEQNLTSGQGSSFLPALRRLFLPARPSFEHYQVATEWYTLRQIPLHLVFFLLGAFAFSLRKRTISFRSVLAVGLVPLWLWFYYFGTVYYGYPSNAAEPTIGASYPRYFLPGMFFLMPLVGLGITSVGQALRSERAQKLILWVTTGSLVVGSVLLFLFDRDSGMVKFLREDVPERVQARRDLSQVPLDAVLIAGRKDKIFYPDRERVLGYTDLSQRQLSALGSLLGRYEIYYNDASGRDAPTWEAEAKKFGYELERVGQIGPDPLYHFVKDEL